MFKIVAFDMDGTIADTIPMCITAFRNSVSPYTDHELSSEEILHTFGINEIGMVKAIVGQNWEAAIEDFYCQYKSLHNEVTSVFPGILKLIAFLKKKNITVALITGKGEKSCTITLEKLGLSEILVSKKFVLFKKPMNPSKFQTHPAVLELFALCAIPAVSLKGRKNTSANNA